MDMILIIGIVIGVFSLVMIISPSVFLKIEKIGNKVLITDSTLFSSPKIAGIIFIILGVFILYTSVLVKKAVFIFQ